MKKNYFLLRIVLLCFLIATGWQSSFGQVGIGTTTPDANAALEINGDDGGLLMPRMALVSTGSSNPLSAHVAGMTVYNTATSGSGATQVTPGFYFNDGTRWVRISGSSDPKTAWELAGNAGTNPTDNFLGTTDNQAFNIRTNNLNRFQITTGNATAGGRLLAYTNGAAATPIYSWQANPGTGMYQQTANVLGFSTNGTERFRIPNANQVHGVNGGTAALPFYSWVGRTNTGMWSPANNTMAFSTNAIEAMRIDANRRVMINTTVVYNTDGNSRLTVNETGSNRSISGTTASGEGVRGQSTTGDGIVGIAASSGTGVYAQGNTGRAMLGLTQSPTLPAVQGQNSSIDGDAIWSFANNGSSFWGENENARGIVSLNRSASFAAIQGQNQNANGPGILGVATNNVGVQGQTTGSGDGVVGFANATGDGVVGISNSTTANGSSGVTGLVANTNGFAGYFQNQHNTGTGVLIAGGNLPAGYLPNQGLGLGVTGRNMGATIRSEVNTGTGLLVAGNGINTYNYSGTGSGVAATGASIGIYSKANNSTSTGLVAVGNGLGDYYTDPDGSGVAATGRYLGVYGFATANEATGVYGTTDGVDGVGVQGDGDLSGILGVGFFGVAGMDNTGGFGYGVYSLDDIGADGVKYFVIDHPQDPANKYLKHANIESNEILNLYRGTETFDSSGQAIVQLPDYYEAININPSYQLTPVGAAMPNLYIAKEVSNGSFVIAGGEPGKKVSWSLTAERNDPYMQKYPHKREMVVDKGERRGKYLKPELYGQPAESGIFASAKKRYESKGVKGQAQEMESSEVKRNMDISSYRQNGADDIKSKKTDNIKLKSTGDATGFSEAGETDTSGSSELQQSETTPVKSAENNNSSFQTED